LGNLNFVNLKLEVCS